MVRSRGHKYTFSGQLERVTSNLATLHSSLSCKTWHSTSGAVTERDTQAQTATGTAIEKKIHKHTNHRHACTTAWHTHSLPSWTWYNTVVPNTIHGCTRTHVLS